MEDENAPLTVIKALTLLGLKKGATLAAVKSAFQALVICEHPDRPGGDPARYSQVLLAYRHLESRVPRAKGLDQDREIMTISPLEAFKGGKRRLARAVGPDLEVMIAAGLRAGDLFQTGLQQVEIAIRPDANLSIEGDHLCLTVEASHSLLQSGGRLEFVIFDQPYRLWISSALAEAGQIYLPGLGLPATGAHAQGDAFLQLVPLASEANGTPAQMRRRQFIADWIEQ